MVRREGARVRCYTKNGHDWADRFPAIVVAVLRIKAKSVLIDGEAVIPDAPTACPTSTREDLRPSRVPPGGRARARAGAIVHAQPPQPPVQQDERPLPENFLDRFADDRQKKSPGGRGLGGRPAGADVMDGVVGAYKNRPRQQSPVGLVRLSKRLQVPEHHGGPSGAQSQDLGALKQDANTPQSLDQPRLTPEIWHRASLRASGTNQGIVPHVPPLAWAAPARAAGTNPRVFLGTPCGTDSCIEIGS